MFVNYPDNNDSWIQKTSAVNLAGEKGCRLQYPAYIDTEFGFDRFYVAGRADAAINSGDILRTWWGTGGVNDVIDVSRFDNGPLYLRFGLSSDGDTTRDGVYVDNVRVTCIATTYSGGGASDCVTLSGTSMATPHVAGVAALVLARTPAHTTASLRRSLVDTGDVVAGLAPSAGITLSGRRLNAFAAVSAPAGSWFTSLVPSRLVDTRSSVALAAGGQLDLSVLGRGGVPGSGVGAVVLNVTATDAVSSGLFDGVAEG